MKWPIKQSIDWLHNIVGRSSNDTRFIDHSGQKKPKTDKLLSFDKMKMTKEEISLNLYLKSCCEDGFSSRFYPKAIHEVKESFDFLTETQFSDARKRSSPFESLSFNPFSGRGAFKAAEIDSHLSIIDSLTNLSISHPPAETEIMRTLNRSEQYRALHGSTEQTGTDYRKAADYIVPVASFGALSWMEYWVFMLQRVSVDYNMTTCMELKEEWAAEMRALEIQQQEANPSMVPSGGQSVDTKHYSFPHHMRGGRYGRPGSKFPPIPRGKFSRGRERGPRGGADMHTKIRRPIGLYCPRLLDITHMQFDPRPRQSHSMWSKLSPMAIVEEFHGVSGTGDIAQIMDCQSFINHVFQKTQRNGVRLMVCDGAEHVGQDNVYAIQGLVSRRMFIAQACIILALTCVGGDAILRVFEPYTTFSNDILFILSIFFDHFSMTHLVSSRGSSSERYVILKGKRDKKPVKAVNYLIKYLGYDDVAFPTSFAVDGDQVFTVHTSLIDPKRYVILKGKRDKKPVKAVNYLIKYLGYDDVAFPTSFAVDGDQVFTVHTSLIDPSIWTTPQGSVFKEFMKKCNDRCSLRQLKYLLYIHECAQDTRIAHKDSSLVYSLKSHWGLIKASSMAEGSMLEWGEMEYVKRKEPLDSKKCLWRCVSEDQQHGSSSNVNKEKDGIDSRRRMPEKDRKEYKTDISGTLLEDTVKLEGGITIKTEEDQTNHDIRVGRLKPVKDERPDSSVLAGGAVPVRIEAKFEDYHQKQEEKESNLKTDGIIHPSSDIHGIDDVFACLRKIEQLTSSHQVQKDDAENKPVILSTVAGSSSASAVTSRSQTPVDIVYALEESSDTDEPIKRRGIGDSSLHYESTKMKRQAAVTGSSTGKKRRSAVVLVSDTALTSRQNQRKEEERERKRKEREKRKKEKMLQQEREEEEKISKDLELSDGFQELGGFLLDEFDSKMNKNR
ncbi:Cap-specific mRNA (nucleoside-2-O-)-methyltransferase 1 like protein [Aduncisulcus paluster]|uniref:Cap-specific mRNA (nucleoside-2'-O-)-methyltransferase 1 n=1 Tax=Aduncisulcus paluster TaxID=2918883 RepID=A0ABQ5KPV2_9EUKA|nr:Cap-specific mRNA (nucleoside-2-O-)-methyltransferase 1 like protein [Aduncisulcus paluster]